MKKKFFIILVFFIIFFLLLFLVEKMIKFDNTENLSTINKEVENTNQLDKDNEKNKEESNDIEDDFDSNIRLVDIDGKKSNYYFEYDGEKFSVIYTYDNWKIIDSYKITNRKDMINICQLLLNEHEIHGNDMNSYRNAEDMAYEWRQHNLAYSVLPDENEYKIRAKDVDFDPADQNKNIIEIYESKTGKKFNISDYL